MKVRFYRGPLNGKTQEIPDGRSHFDVQTYNGSLFPMMQNFPPGQVMIAPSVKVDTHRYVRTHHTHPDGSVFFEWEMPKGTKTGVKRRRKPKKNPQAVNWNISTSSSATLYTQAQMRAHYGVVTQNPADIVKGIGTV